MLAIHSGIATLVEEPALAISETQAKSLAEALRNVARHYDFLAGASQKAVDWGNLITVAGFVYVPMFHAVRNRRETAQRPAPGLVVAVPDPPARPTPSEPAPVARPTTQGSGDPFQIDGTMFYVDAGAEFLN